MRRRALVSRLLAVLGIAIMTAAATPVLVPEVSQDRISIRGDFNGAQLLLFGAITYPAGTRNTDQADIVVVLKGPVESIVVREKQQIAGIWINAASSEFRSAPGFYAVASSKPIDEIVDGKTADIYELGLNHLQLSPAGAIDSRELDRFVDGLVDLNARGNLFKNLPNSVKITNSVLYQARINLPASVPVGDYTAETFLILDGRVEAAEVKEVTIEKIGMGRFITNLSQKNGFLYGLIAVFISVFLGWSAGYLFRKM
ncbi:TIGR02186 family protein [uncultured Parasphingorhabdus sp.]|uniref:TIGR02186 family protein n=1 Tax=uncultured Parasphingorhabdus sp. TaxID=2709694 RepID=UPI0030D75410|tara:strand:+ start:12931 stop:13701 length:771 start_codon:yes stop_codon:yes gene_type:complete